MTRGPNGLELVRWVRHQRFLRELIIMVCSADWKEPELNQAYTLGADCCVSKASDFADVIYRLQRVQRYWFTQQA